MTDDGTRLRPAPAWAHAHGLVRLNGEPRLPSAEVRARIEERIHRYCWGFDERREDILADCFTPDAVWQGSVMGETQVGPFRGREAAVGWLTRFWPHQRDQRRHIFVNLIVDEATNDTATAYAYLVLLGSQDARTEMESVGLYRFDLVRLGPAEAANEGDWRIAVLSAGFDSPFWKGETRDMSPRVRDRFGVHGGATSGGGGGGPVTGRPAGSAPPGPPTPPTDPIGRTSDPG